MNDQQQQNEQAPVFADGGQARAYLLEHDKTARALNAMSDRALTEIERQALARAGQQRLSGGPQSHDELVSSILELRFPLAAQARDTYYASMGVTPARVIS